MPPASHQRAHQSGTSLPYLLAVGSATRLGAGPWPLLVYLHGAGESGSDPKGLLAHGATGTPPMLMEARAAHLQGYIVASPQTDEGWSSRRMGQRVLGLVDELLARPELNLDPKKVILTGVSMGGVGTWAIASAHPRRFAAVVPICGATDAGLAALAHTPVWIWHGANDVVMDVRHSDEAERALKAAGGDVRYTRLPSAPAPVGWPHYTGHAAWIPAYAAESPLWAWLAEQQARRGKAAPADGNGVAVGE